MLRMLPIPIVFGAIVSSALIPGIWADRWTASAAFEQNDGRLSNVPLTVGDWSGQDVEVSVRERDAANAKGLLHRRYVNGRTGGAISLMIVFGRPGPVSVHTPDICYPGSGFDEVGAVSRFDLPGAPGGQMWARRFQKASAAPTQIRVLYGWTADGKWQAPDNPRLAFVRAPFLYKMYVVRQLARPDESIDGDPAVEFLRAFLPPLRDALFPAS